MAKLSILTVLFLCFLTSSSAQFKGLPVIRNTTLGQVLGSLDTPVTGMVQVEKYFGIPYAQPPIENLRFEEPEMMSPWTPDVLKTLTLHPACPQIDEDMSYIAEHRVDFNDTDEDCLYLNVFVPVITNVTRTSVARGANDTGIPDGTTYGLIDKEPMAVLVFIHGGSNVVGTANMFDGDILASAGGVVVVTVNYRLAALGFLGTGDPDFPGNYGILDQIAALRWVQDNIASFNGDPRKVTVMGHSAASMDVGVLLVSPLAKGLFRTAICQSGAPSSVLTNRWSGHDSFEEVLALGKHFKCEDTTLKGVKECLKKIDVIALTKSYPMYDWYQFPVIVGEKVLPRMPAEMMQTVELNADTFLIGTTRDEAGKWAYDVQGYANISNLLILIHVLPAAIDFKELVRFEYTDLTFPENSTSDVRIASMAYGDSLFDAPTVESLQILAKRNISIHQYRWEWRSELFPAPEVTGVPHGSDMFYLFGSPLRGHELFNYTQADVDMSFLMMRQWTNFVKFGSFEVNEFDWPRPLPAVENLRYDSMNKAYTRFYSVNGRPAMGLGYNLKPREAKFWNTVIPNLHSDINRTLANWDPNRDKNTTTVPTVDRPVDVAELWKQKNIFLILFIIFLALSCLLLLLLMFICVMFCTKKTKYSTK